MDDELVLKTVPLGSLEEALAWGPGVRLVDSACRATVELASRPPSNGKKKMVCHDLAGNYHDDACFQGSWSLHYYNFWEWRSIDIFVYFSHYMISIPPVGWINTGHRNGVKCMTSALASPFPSCELSVIEQVLGTFIVEYDEGKTKAEQFLKDDETASLLVQKLVDLAAYFRFDGWLLNFEVELDSTLIPRLISFCKSLTEKTHKVLPGSLVIWYDAITSAGELKWQDRLDDCNIDYFNVTDGILLNYQWKADTLPDDVEEARGYSTDVYVGLDVWGRNTKEYGAFMDIPRGLKSVEDVNLSVCLFAPAYSYEKYHSSAWEVRDKAFWDGVTAVWGKESRINRFPFVSTFNRGYGQAMFIEGQMVSNSSWYNISMEDVQPNRYNEGSSKLEGTFSFVAAYSGGSCYRIAGSLHCGETEWIPLYDTEILLEDDTVQASFTYIPSRTATSILVVVLVPGSSNEANKLDVHSELTPRVIVCEPVCGSHTFMRANEVAPTMIYPGSKMEIVKPTPENEKANSVGPQKMWKTLEYHLTNVKGYMVHQLSVLNVGIVESDTETSCETYVGAVSLVPETPSLPNPVRRLEGTVLALQEEEGGKRLNAHLIWAVDPGDTPSSDFHVYHILPGRTNWIGVAHTNEFFVTRLHLQSGQDKAVFCVQPISVYGSAQSLEESAQIALSLQQPSRAGRDVTGLGKQKIDRPDPGETESIQ